MSYNPLNLYITHIQMPSENLKPAVRTGSLLASAALNSSFQPNFGKIPKQFKLNIPELVDLADFSLKTDRPTPSQYNLRRFNFPVGEQIKAIDTAIDEDRLSEPLQSGLKVLISRALVDLKLNDPLRRDFVDTTDHQIFRA